MRFVPSTDNLRTWHVGYTTPAGQVVLAGLAAMFICGLWWLKRMVADDPPARFLPVREVPR